MGKTVQRVVVIATINSSATMSTDPVLWDVLLDTRGPFVLNSVRLESTGLTVQRAVVIVSINPSATMSTDPAMKDALLDTRGFFVLNHANRRSTVSIVHRHVVQTVAVKLVTT